MRSALWRCACSHGGCRVIHREPADLQARAQLQYAVFLSMAGAAAGTSVHVSHGIGHVLGAHAGVPHGETSSRDRPGGAALDCRR
jgi:alcohol dehydrogenase class IV